MAITKLSILNASDKTRHYTVAIGEGEPAATDALVLDLKTYPVGSQYTDTSGKAFYVRTGDSGETTDWTSIG